MMLCSTFIIFLMPFMVNGKIASNAVLQQHLGNTHPPIYSRNYTKSDILRYTLTHKDFMGRVVTLREGTRMAFHLKKGDTLRLVFPVPSPSPLRLSFSPCTGDIRWTFSYRRPSFFKWDTEKASEKCEEEGNNSIPTKKKRNAVVKRLGQGRRIFKTKILPKNYHLSVDRDPPTEDCTDGPRSFQEVQCQRGDNGDDPWIFERHSSRPGLYIIKVEGASNFSEFQAVVSTDYFSTGDISGSLKSHEGIDDHSLTIKWRSRRIMEDSLSCLVISRRMSYSSLCLAKEYKSRLKKGMAFDASMVIGCTPDLHYTLPAISRKKIYYVSVWEENSLIPFVQASIKSNGFKKPRLIPGKLVYFNLKAGKTIVTTFRVKKPGKKLHVGVISCTGGVEVAVKFKNGNDRVVTAKGREALHLAIKEIPNVKKLTIEVSPQTKNTVYRVYLVATHSARRLPIPRLPKNVNATVLALNCTSASIKWRTARGSRPHSPSYCIGLRYHPSGKPPDIHPPLQCGWENAINRNDFFDLLRCMPAIPGRRQKYVFTNLKSNSSYLVNVLVRHPTTLKTLALSPAMLTTPPCDEESNAIIGYS